MELPLLLEKVPGNIFCNRHTTGNKRTDIMDDSLTPNGIESYLETHYEVVCHLEHNEDYDGTHANIASTTGGRGRMYELAQFLTTKFEKLHEGRSWDGEFFDELEKFLKDEDSYIGF